MELKEEGIPLNEIAVIYYRHAQAANIIEMVQKKDIAYKVRKRINVLDLPIIQNLLSLMKYISDESQKPFAAEDMLFQILHFRFFRIDPIDVAAIAVYADEKRLRWRNVLSDELL